METRPAKNKGKAAKPQPKQEKNKQAQPVRPPAPEPEAGNEHWFPWGKVAFALLLIAFGFAMWGSFHPESEEHTGRPVAQPAVNQSLTTPEPRALQNVSADPRGSGRPRADDPDRDHARRNFARNLRSGRVRRNSEPFRMDLLW